MVKKTLKILIVFVVSLSIVLTLWGFAIKAYHNREVKDVVISINLNGKERLITENDILIAVQDIIVNKTIAQIDPSIIEFRCLNIPWVKTADVSMNLDGVVSIRIEQRNPLLRLWKNSSESLYLDYQGFFPLKDGYPIRVINVSGAIPYTSVSFAKFNEPEELQDMLKSNVFYKLLCLSDYIYNDDFMNALSEQIFLSTDGNVSIEPKIFNHSIVFGELNDFELKISKLKAMYLYLFEKNEINKYSTINLNYKGQVVCTINNYKLK